MRVGALVGTLLGVWLGLALVIGLWEMLLVAALGVAGYAIGRIAIDARRRPAPRRPARTPGRYERDDLADDLAAPRPRGG
ncbi:MAG: hypothetical protein QOK40_1963 [Miltoncostaeaceae bacterium]|jgi:uncharacterized membrane protein|nr:hypothetical protein [Miltoncostaeaceae bacterium]